MNLLLDTHAFIWWYSEPEKLPDRVLAACQDVTNLLALSVASVWEMQIKAQLGKLQLTKPTGTESAAIVARNTPHRSSAGRFAHASPRSI